MLTISGERADEIDGADDEVRTPVDPIGPCEHLESAPTEVKPDGDGRCKDCVREGTTPVHLRICLACGNVGCCDSSAGRHADKHFHTEQAQGHAQLRAQRGLALVLHRPAARVASVSAHAPTRTALGSDPMPSLPRRTKSVSCSSGRRGRHRRATERCGVETTAGIRAGRAATLVRYESAQVGAGGTRGAREPRRWRLAWELGRDDGRRRRGQPRRPGGAAVRRLPRRRRRGHGRPRPRAHAGAVAHRARRPGWTPRPRRTCCRRCG